MGEREEAYWRHELLLADFFHCCLLPYVRLIRPPKALQKSFTFARVQKVVQGHHNLPFIHEAFPTEQNIHSLFEDDFDGKKLHSN